MKNQTIKQMKNEPIKSQKEADEVRRMLAESVAKAHNVSLGQAFRRVDAFNSVQQKLMDKFGANSPDDMIYQVIVDIAMAIPQI
jgi:hypothetical protein